MINIYQKSFYILEFDIVEELIREHTLNKDYEFLVENKSFNDSHLIFSVTGIDYLGKDFNNIEDGNFKWIGTGTFMNYLCHKEIIPKGDYLINISW